MSKSIPEMLSTLYEKGWFDEELAIGVGSFMPNKRVPSTQSVYRWRRGSANPDFYAGAIEELFAAATAHPTLTITLPLRG